MACQYTLQIFELIEMHSTPKLMCIVFQNTNPDWAQGESEPGDIRMWQSHVAATVCIHSEHGNDISYKYIGCSYVLVW